MIGADLKANAEVMRLHRQAEQIIEESGIPYTFLRPNEFMQNFINFHGHSIKNNNAFYLPMESAKVSVVDVRDIAAVAVKALTENGDNNKHNNKIYLIAGPEALSYHQMAQLLSNATGKKISYTSISEEEARAAMKEMGMDDWLINAILELYDYFRKEYASQVSSAVNIIIFVLIAIAFIVGQHLIFAFLRNNTRTVVNKSISITLLEKVIILFSRLTGTLC